MSVITATRRRATFHPLRVAEVEPLTEEAVAVTFDVPPELREEFAYAAGQHLTLRTGDGSSAKPELRRSYSICTPAPPAGSPSPERVQVAVKRLEGGAFSSWLHRELRPGHTVEVMTPQGQFTARLDPATSRHHVAVAAGSGITPVLSIVATVLETEPNSRVTLLYGNRRTSSVMFLEELEGLKNLYPSRLHLVHVLSREPQDVELFSGRLEGDRLAALLDVLVPVESVDEWYLCGPFQLVVGARELLRQRGADPAHVHAELFHVEDTPPAERSETERAMDDVEAVVEVTLDGRTTQVRMTSRAQSILAATLEVRADAPFSCTGGVCGTCRARVIEGEVRMDRNYALEPEEIAAGVVLACQSHPVSDTVVLSYDT